jgi:hypothetical protein
MNRIAVVDENDKVVKYVESGATPRYINLHRLQEKNLLSLLSMKRIIGSISALNNADERTILAMNQDLLATKSKIRISYLSL